MKSLKIYQNISQYLKLVIFRKSPAKKIIWTYFSELAPELGEERASLNAELAYLNKYANLAMVGSERFMRDFWNSSEVAVFSTK